MKISSKDISVVVQGAINIDTKKYLKSVRKYLPKAEIILSTWEGSNLKDLDYDILIENKDPGAVLMDSKIMLYNNVNRQLVSTQNGLKKASRKYTLKLRTDFYLTGNRFLKYFDKFSKKDEKYSCLNKKLIVGAALSRLTSEIGIPTPFHPSDFFFFGLTEDMKKYFDDTKLSEEKDMALYEYKYTEKKPYKQKALNFRFAPEQYLCVSFAKRNFPNINFDDWTDWNDENIDFSKKFFVSNFICLGYAESDIFSDKHWQAMLYEEKKYPGIITYNIYQKMYKELLDNNYDDSTSILDKYRKKYKILLAAIPKGIENIYYSFF